MSEGHTVSFDLEVNASDVEKDLATVNSLLTTYVALANRAGLPPDVMKTIRLLQQARLVIEMTIKSIQMLIAAELASGPTGWLVAAGSMGIALFAYTDLLGDMQG